MKNISGGVSILLANAGQMALCGFLCWLAASYMGQFPAMSWALIGVGAAIGLFGMYNFKSGKGGNNDCNT